MGGGDINNLERPPVVTFDKYRCSVTENLLSVLLTDEGPDFGPDSPTVDLVDLVDLVDPQWGSSPLNI